MWADARAEALTPGQCRSPLGRRPPDHRIDGQADATNQRVTDALGTPEADQDPDEGDADSEPAA